MSLSSQQVKQFRTIGHRLNPVVIIASGLSDNVRAEIDRALEDHELIKVKIAGADREEKKALVAELLEASGAELVQQIGNIALIHRPAKKPSPRLSNILRHRDLG